MLLAAHADVVGVEREKWIGRSVCRHDPRRATCYGRGAIDFKGGMAVFARAVMMLAENKVPLARDVIFLAEADEEGGAVQHHLARARRTGRRSTASSR